MGSVIAAFTGNPTGSRRRLAGLTAMLAGLALLSTGACQGAAAATTPGTVTTYDLPPGYINPAGIVTGPDGNLWFTELGIPAIGKITTSGQITSYPVPSPPGHGPNVITLGADGDLWYTNRVAAFYTGNEGYIGRITTSGQPTVVTRVADPEGITAGPRGSIWFTTTGPCNGSVGRISASGKVTYFRGHGIDQPHGITAGPHGSIWFVNYANSTIGRITQGGRIREFTRPGISEPQNITQGPHGAMWFTSFGNSKIGRITYGGRVTVYGNPGISRPIGISPGPDGAIWFTNSTSDTVGRMTASGQMTFYTDPTISDPSIITPGPDGNMWFTNNTGPSASRITTTAGT